MRKESISLISIISLLWLGWAGRLLWLGKQSLWYDEGVSWYLTRLSWPELLAWTAADIQPPLYYLLLWLSTRFLGQSEWALRFPSAVLGLLTLPLLWQLGRQLFRNRGAALLALTLGAAAPLLIYYSQEARMYSLLVTLACAGSYLFWRLLESPGRQPVRLTLAYAVVMAAALYTHYFAAFLLVTHALYLLGRMVFGYRQNLRTAWAAVMGAGLLFSPWLSVLLARLGDDPSYWPGTLKLPEIFLDVLISFALGGKREMIFEAQALPLIIGFVGLLLFCLGWLIWLSLDQTSRIHHQGWTFLLLWLVLPVLLVILLSYQTPKFNPRYTMLAWPAFALLLAGGLGLSRSGWSTWVAVLGCIFIVAAWQLPLRNWFPGATVFNAFSKDDFRAVAQFVRERSLPGDTVLLSSGHFAPVWAYYFGDTGWTPLPRMERLDAGRVTDLSIREPLQAALDGQQGAWLVRWQDEVVDPNQVVPLLLDSIGTERDDEYYGADFWGVRLDYWRLDHPLRLPQPYPHTQMIETSFADQVTLQSWYQPNTEEVVLYWTAQTPLTRDDQIVLRLVDEANVFWDSGPYLARPADYRYPVERWPVETAVPGRHPLPWAAGTPPGQYWLQVSWLTPDGNSLDVLDTGGNPQGRSVRLGPITRTTVAVPPTPATKARSVASGLGVISATLDLAEVETGGRVLLDSLWHLTAATVPVDQVRLGWRDANGAVFTMSLVLPDTVSGPTVFRVRQKLATPYTAAAGPARLQVGPGTASPVDLAALTLLPTERNFAPPPRLDVPSETRFGGRAHLLGARLDRQVVPPGESLNLTLYWQSLATFDRDYTVFVHALGPDGLPRIIADHPPPRPTSNWLEGEIIADPVPLDVPPDLPPGRYPVEVGLYDAAAAGFPRLPVDGSTRDYLILFELEVTARE